MLVAGLLLLLVGSREVLQSINALTATMRPPVCTAHGVVDLQPSPWNLTSSDEIVSAVATWQHYELEESTGMFVGDTQECDVRPSADLAGPLTLGSTTASRWLVWDLFAFAPLYPLVIALVAWRHAKAKRTRVLFAIGATIVAAADVSENLLLRRAIVTAAERPDASVATGLLNVAGSVKWIVVLALLLALGLRSVRHLDALLGSADARAAVKSLRLAWVPAATVLAFLVVVLRVEQVLDAIRRWGVGQLLATSLAAVVFACIASVSTAGAVRPREAAPVFVERAEDEAERYRARPGLLWLLLTGAALAVVASLTGLRGLLIPAILIASAAVLSMVSKRVSVPPIARTHREDEASRRRVAGWVGATVLLGLGLGMIRAAGRSDFFLPVPHRDVDLALIVVGLLLCAATPVAARCLHLMTTSIAKLDGRRSFIALGVMGALSIAPVAILMFDAVTLSVAPLVGTVVLFVLFLASGCTIFAAGEWIGEWFTQRPARYDYGLPPILRSMQLKRPPIGGLLAVWFLLSGLADPGGYHSVRTQTVEAASPSYTLDQAVKAWLERDRPEAGGARSARVMLIVGASGGGVRAAYWTAAVLDCVIERTSADGDPCRGAAPPDTVAARRSALFLMSGVSGGSLGLVEYVTAVAATGEDRDGWASSAVTAPEDRWYEHTLGEDFLAPVAAGLLFDDFIQGFLRDDGGTDRADLLEESWERAWPNGELEDGFLESQRLERAQPVLVLNGYSVEDGCRFAVTALSTNAGRGAQDCDVPELAADGDESGVARTLLNGTTDLHDFLCATGTERATFDDIRLSTAALLSARFPYVSPSGRLVSSACGAERQGGDLTYVVDGGYRESSAASAVVELMPDLEQSIMRQRSDQCVVPFYVQIDNGYAAPRATKPDDSPEELLVPPSALSASRDGQNAVARTAVARAFNRLRMVSSTASEQLVMGVPVSVRIGIDSPSQRWMVITPRERPGAEAPLGWVLSDASQLSLNKQLSVNAEQIEYLRALLDGGATCTASVAGE